MCRQSIKSAGKTASWMIGAVLFGATLAVMTGPILADHSTTQHTVASPNAAACCTQPLN